MAKQKLMTFREWSQKMAKARAKSLTPARRKEIAQQAARARWGNKEKP